MTRPAICARIHALRQTLDLLQDVANVSGGEPLRTYGSAKVELIGLERELAELDRSEGRPTSGRWNNYGVPA